MVKSVAAVLLFSATSMALSAATLTVTRPSAVGVTLKVYSKPLLATKSALLPLITVMSVRSNPVTSSLKVTVIGMGESLVGPGLAVEARVTVGTITSFIAVGSVSAALTFPAASVAVTEGAIVPSVSVVPSIVISKLPPVAVPLPMTVAPPVNETFTVEPSSAVPTTWIAAFSALLMKLSSAMEVIAGVAGATVSCVAVGVIAATLTLPAASVAVTEGTMMPSIRAEGAAEVPSSVMLNVVSPPESCSVFITLFVPSLKTTVTKELASAVPSTTMAVFSALLMSSFVAIETITGASGSTSSNTILNWVATVLLFATASWATPPAISTVTAP